MNLEKLKIESTLPALSFNFDQLKEWAKGLTEKYNNLIIGEDDVAQAKKDMAELNKAKNGLDTARKETIKRLSEPFKQFEDQIKEICNTFDTTRFYLGEQVTRFELAECEKKQEAIEELIVKLVDASDSTNGKILYPVVRADWLNKTTSMKAIKEAIQNIIAQEIERLKAQRELEQARHDRRLTIETYVVGKNAETGLSLSVSYFMLDFFTDPGNPLADIYKGIDAEFNRIKLIADREKAEDEAGKAQEQLPAPAVTAPEEVIPVQPEPEPAGETRTMSVAFAYDLKNEAKVKDCLKTLESLCLNFGVRSR